MNTQVISVWVWLVDLSYSPVALRGYLTTYVNFCWGIGQVIGIGVIKAMLGRTDQWAYRIPYALQWMWPVPLLIGIACAPESPWWLVRKGKLDKAKKALNSLTSRTKDSDFDADETVGKSSTLVPSQALPSFFRALSSLPRKPHLVPGLDLRLDVDHLLSPETCRDGLLTSL